jgi:hypothetical protein
MHRLFYFSILVLIFTGCAGLAAAHTTNDEINSVELRNHPELFDGRSVEITGRVIAINADSKSLELFDSESKTTLRVRLEGLTRAQRDLLISSDVRRVRVVGRASMSRNRLVIDAEKVELVDANVKSESSKDSAAAESRSQKD